MTVSNQEQYAVEVAIPGLKQALTYRLTPPLEDVGIGSFVTIELGKREATGWVIKRLPLTDVKSSKTKEKEI